MSTYQDAQLCEPVSDEKIPTATLRYMRTRNQRRLYSLLMEEFEKCGITRAELARRLGKKHQDVISRWFAGPSNWRVDTISDLLFAMSGAEADFTIRYPLRDVLLNSNQPSWLLEDEEQADNLPDISTPVTIESANNYQAVFTPESLLEPVE